MIWRRGRAGGYAPRTAPAPDQIGTDGVTEKSLHYFSGPSSLSPCATFSIDAVIRVTVSFRSHRRTFCPAATRGAQAAGHSVWVDGGRRSGFLALTAALLVPTDEPGPSSPRTLDRETQDFCDALDVRSEPRGEGQGGLAVGRPGGGVGAAVEQGRKSTSQRSANVSTVHGSSRFATSATKLFL